MLRFACPQCHAPLQVGFEQAGRMVRCAKCKCVVPAPKSAGPLAVIPDAEEDEIRIRIDVPPVATPAYEPDAEPMFPVPSASNIPELYDDGEYERRRHTRNMLLVSVGVVSALATVLLVVVLIAVNAGNDSDPKAKPVAVAAARPVQGIQSQPRPTASIERPRPMPAPQNNFKVVPVEPAPRTEPQPPSSQPSRPPENPLVIVIEREFIPDMERSPDGLTERYRPKTDKASMRPPQSDDNEPPAPIPGKLMRELVPGYETRQIHGFTVLLSTQAVKEGKKDNGRPFRALQIEFDGLAEVLSPAALKILRKVPIWIEWDNRDRPTFGTFGQRPALAKYYGGNIWTPTAAESMKADSVELLSLKTLSAEKNSAIQRTRLVLLHELAHAVHYLLVGYDNSGVQFAYKLAMERRLYDDVMTSWGRKEKAYAATNEREYFAELTCAYLDCCNYFPFDRDELREHDQAGYKMMEQVWGKARKPAATK